MLQKTHFVVDASVLRELGEMLIGRPAIALGELIKNSFDADATTCRIEFTKDEIVVSDNGIGMSGSEFMDYWMRLGTTHKLAERLSERGRSMTGSKGIGRLAVQFLAEEMVMESASGKEPGRSLYAFVDWKSAVSGEELSKVDVLWEKSQKAPDFPGGSKTGTRISLKKLKSEWDEAAIERLGDEVWRLRSPFKRSRQPNKVTGQDFYIEVVAPEMKDAQQAFDKRLATVFANWRARIRGSLDGGRSGGKGVITVEFEADYPKGAAEAQYRTTVPLPVPHGKGKTLIDRAEFEILVFKPEGPQWGGIAVRDLRDYLATFGNVSLYDANFRLPYYGSGHDAAGHDWLSIALDQGRRLDVSELLPERFRTRNKYMQDLPAPGRIFGAVDIDTNHERDAALKAKALPGEWLQIQPGRDRLHDNLAFSQLRDFVRLSLDFYANRFRLRDLQTVEKSREREAPSKKYERALTTLERNKEDVPRPVFRILKKEIADARKGSITEERAIDRRAALLAPLASAGMVALALNHEFSRERTFLDRIGNRLHRIAKKYSILELEHIVAEFTEATRRLGSLQELFAPLVSDVDKEASDRLRVRAVVDQTVGAMRILMPGVEFDLSGIPNGLRFPLGSLAEWNALLQNVLANAWNAVLDTAGPKVSFLGGSSRGKEWLRISDNGCGLDIPLSEADKLFEPFVRRLELSEDKRSIALGGQGLGLAIVRMIAVSRSTRVAFVDPEYGFTTTFEISWRGAKK